MGNWVICRKYQKVTVNLSREKKRIRHYHYKHYHHTSLSQSSCKEWVPIMDLVNVCPYNISYASALKRTSIQTILNMRNTQTHPHLNVCAQHFHIDFIRAGSCSCRLTASRWQWDECFIEQEVDFNSPTQARPAKSRDPQTRWVMGRISSRREVIRVIYTEQMLNASVVLTLICNYTAKENVRDNLMYSKVVLSGKYAPEVGIMTSE